MPSWQNLRKVMTEPPSEGARSQSGMVWTHPPQKTTLRTSLSRSAGLQLPSFSSCTSVLPWVGGKARRCSGLSCKGGREKEGISPRRKPQHLLEGGISLQGASLDLQAAKKEAVSLPSKTGHKWPVIK